jgi:AcrR family transcriptional regulator
MKRKEATKDRILESGLEVFSGKGYIGATTREIASGAGVAEVTLFRHFSSKERLFEEVVNRYSFLPALKGLLPELRKMDYRDALPAIALRFLEILEQRRELLRIVLGEMHRSPKLREISRHFTGEMFKTLASYFKDLQERGILRTFNAESAARAFFGMFFSYFIREGVIGGKKIRKADLKAIAGEYSDIFARGTVKERFE